MRVRWWPAIVLLAGIAGALVYTWGLADLPSTQARVIPTFSILFFGALALVAWLLLFSRLPGRVRGWLAVGIAVVVGAGLALLEIKRVDGNLVPIVGWRFSGDRTFDDRAVGGAPVDVGGDDWPQLYGPGRASRAEGVRLATDWESNPPRELWRRPVGEACSGFAVFGDAAVTHELRGDDEVVVRYDLDTGEQVWWHASTAPFRTTVGGSGPRATPTIDRGAVYAMGATGELTALDLVNGSVLWQRDVLADRGHAVPDWGAASSPLVVGDLVVVQMGNRGVGIAAYRREDGALAWTAGEDAGTYNSPTLATVAGVDRILVVYRDSVVAHDPASGAVSWSHPWPFVGERITMPLVIGDDRVLVSAGYGAGSRMIRVARASGGAWTTETVWDSPRLKSKFGPLVFHDGVVFGLDDGVLTALDPGTGERRWKRGRHGHGQFILVDGHLLIQEEDGDVVLVEANPEAYREVARLDALDGRTWNPPALAGHVLLVRNDREAAAFELPSPPPAVSASRRPSG